MLVVRVVVQDAAVQACSHHQVVLEIHQQQIHHKEIMAEVQKEAVQGAVVVVGEEQEPLERMLAQVEMVEQEVMELQLHCLALVQYMLVVEEVVLGMRQELVELAVMVVVEMGVHHHQQQLLVEQQIQVVVAAVVMVDKMVLLAAQEL